MTIGCITKINLNPRLSVSLNQNGPSLPPEVWRYILFIFSQSAGLKQIVSVDPVCKLFYDFFFEQLTQLRILNLLTHLKEVPKQVSSSQIEYSLPHQVLLAVSKDGKQYSCAKLDDYGHILNILTFCNKTHSFNLISLNLNVYLSKLDPSSENNNRIVSCHLTTNGFFAVTRSGISEWKHKNGKPVLSRVFCPFKKYEENKQTIFNSGYKNGHLYVKTSSNPHFWAANVQDDNPDFVPIEVPKIFDHPVTLDLVSCGERVFIGHSQNYQVSLHEIDSLFTKDKLTFSCELSTQSLNYSGHLLFTSLPRGSDRWLVVYYASKEGNHINIINMQENILWLGEEWNITLPLGDKGALFLNENFFLVFYSTGAFRAFLLSNKREYTEQLRPHLEPYLKYGASIFSMAFSADKTKGSMLTILMQKENEDHIHSLIEIKFFLSNL